MLRVELSDARPGMELAMPITHPASPGTILLRAGFKLDQKTIDRLRTLHAREVWIAYPGMEFVAEQINPAIIAAGQRLSAAIGEAFGEVMPEGHARLDYAPYRRAVGELAERLLDSPKAATLIIDLAGSQIPLSRSAGHGSFLSLVMGLKLDTYLLLSRARLGAVARDVSGLGLGALLRDVGLTTIEPEQRWRWRLADDDVDPEWRDHIYAGYELVRGDVEPSAAAAVLHHHQRFDGTGFPKRTDLHGCKLALRGTNIHIFARIIAAADQFDRLRHPPLPHGRTAPPVPVVRVLNRMLRTDMAAGFDPVVLAALVHAVPPFPAGSMVKLSDGRPATVMRWDPLDPCRPEVGLLDPRALEPGCFREPSEIIDLREADGLQIAEAEGHNVSADVFLPESPAEFDIRRVQAEMISRPVEESAA